jgi:hypothetical protein
MKKLLGGMRWGSHHQPPNIQENKQVATTSDSKSCLSYAFFSLFLSQGIFFLKFFIFLAKLQTTSFTQNAKRRTVLL